MPQPTATKRLVATLALLPLLVAAAMAVGSCRREARTARSILPPGVELRQGDVVFRRGTGATSHFVAAADISGRYTHVGVAVATDSGMMIVHAVPDEPDFEGDPDRVKLEPPGRFFSATRAARGAVARVADTAAAHAAARNALEAYGRHTLFDHNYDDSDTLRLYCCQLVTWAYARAGLKLADTGTHAIKFGGVIDVACTLPSDIFNSEALTVVAVF